MEKEFKFRLVKHIEFLENELKDYPAFKGLAWREYNADRNVRRNVERWIENIINSSVDISKVVLTAEGHSLPDTYKETIKKLSLVPGFDEEIMDNLSRRVTLRNIISHEYLDIRWASIKKFIEETEGMYSIFLDSVKKYIDDRIKRDSENT